MTTIVAKKNLVHQDGTQSFTKGKSYVVKAYVYNEASLIDKMTTNDQGHAHIIGSFWRDFKIVK